jgi:putative transposase
MITNWTFDALGGPATIHATVKVPTGYSVLWLVRNQAGGLTDNGAAAPFMPARSPLGRPRSRAVVDALLDIASTRCQWRELPKDFPPYSTVQGYLYEWARDGRLATAARFQS